MFQFGTSEIHRMVRILRKTIMVRVGGGWEPLEVFLSKHDPCRKIGKLENQGTNNNCFTLYFIQILAHVKGSLKKYCQQLLTKKKSTSGQISKLA